MSAEPLLPPLFEALAKFGRVDELPFRDRYTDKVAQAKCVILTRDDVAAYARSAQAAAQGWLPIESAPKDGTTVLLCRHMGDFGFVRGYGRYEGEDGAFLSGWITVGFDPVMSNLGLAHPTHWQPLPPPPQNLIAKE